MKIIAKPRAGGKTHDAIELANEYDAYLVVHDKKEAMRVDQQYRPKRRVITYQDLLTNKHAHPNCKVVIDNVEMFLQSLTHLQVIGFSVNKGEVEKG